MKMSNSNKEEFNKQVTAEGEEMNVKIVTIDVKKIEKLQNILIQTEQENKQLKSDINNCLNLKKILFKIYKKTKEKIRGCQVINNMRAVINTSAPSLGEEGTKTIEDLNTQMVLMEEDNIKLCH